MKRVDIQRVVAFDEHFAWAGFKVESKKKPQGVDQNPLIQTMRNYE